MCVRNHWAPGRVAFRLKAAPVKIRILYPLSFTTPVSKGTPATTMLGNTGNPSMTPTGPEAPSTVHSDVQLEGKLFKSIEHIKTTKVEIMSILEMVQVLLLSTDQ